MKVKIFRFNSEKEGKEHYEYYDVEVPYSEKWTVMDLLDYIFENMDSSLSYYSHSTCRHGICGRCTLRVNGTPALACTKVIEEAEEITLEPLKGRKVVKDLVTEQEEIS